MNYQKGQNKERWEKDKYKIKFKNGKNIELIKDKVWKVTNKKGN